MCHTRAMINCETREFQYDYYPLSKTAQTNTAVIADGRLKKESER